MISNEFLQHVKQGTVTHETVRSELPALSTAELKVLAFEMQAMSLNAALNGLSAAIRNELIPRRKHLIAELNSIAFDPYFQRQAKFLDRMGQREDAQNYLLKYVRRDLRELSQIDAQIASMQEEQQKIQSKWVPIKRLADGMRKQFDEAREQEIREEDAAEPRPSMVLPESMNSFASSHSEPLPEVPAALPAVDKVTISGDWLGKMQQKVYGGRHGK